MTTRALWDFSEYDNYTCYHIPNDDSDEPERFVYIKNNVHPDTMEKNADIMAFLDSFTKDLQHYVSSDKHLKSNKCLQLFVHTEHTFYELEKNTHFRGVNKPKNVHHCKNAKHSIGKDGKLRAHNRYVMIVIPYTPQELYDLYCHEITHTLCNHVQFRSDDHHGTKKEDFPHCEKIVKKLSDELELLPRLEDKWVEHSL